MKKLIVSAAVILTSVFVLSSQNLNAQSYASNEGWYASVAGGINVYGSEHNKELVATKLIAPAGDLAVGKWFNPYISARLSLNFLGANGATYAYGDGGSSFIKQNSDGSPVKANEFLKNKYDGGSEWLYLQQFYYLDIHADIMVNVSNLFGGAKKVNKHFWNACPYVGLGFPKVVTYGSSEGLPLSVNAGLYNAFAVNDKIDVIAEIRGAILDEGFDGEVGGRKLEGHAGMTFGICYKF